MVAASTRAREIFHPDEVTCYTGLLLTAYARLLGYKPKLGDEMTNFLS